MAYHRRAYRSKGREEPYAQAHSPVQPPGRSRGLRGVLRQRTIALGGEDAERSTLRVGKGGYRRRQRSTILPYRGVVVRKRGAAERGFVLAGGRVRNRGHPKFRYGRSDGLYLRSRGCVGAACSLQQSRNGAARPTFHAR